MSSFINLTDLLEETDKLTDWYTMGVFLKMPTKDLDDIEKRFSTAHGVTRCKIALFTLWLQRNPNASWDQIAQALEKCDQIGMADRIRKCHPPPPTSLPADGAAAAKSPEQQKPAVELSESSISKYPLPPTLPAPQPSPQQEPVKLVRLERDKVVEFRKIETSYAQLVLNLKTSLDEKQVPLVKLARYLISLLMENNELLQASTIDELFHLISPHYCFLNTSILGDIIERFIGEPLKHELEEYDRQLDEFKESTSMDLLEEIGPQYSLGVEAPQVTIKLTRCYLPVTVRRFQQFIEQIFDSEENSTALANISVRKGCISVTWLARRSAIPSLIAQAQDKTEFMRLVGVLRVSVAGIDILEQEEEEDTFLSSALRHAARRDSEDAVEMLLSLKADPNSSNSKGFTPLMIACGRGNIRIATLLLQARANINQLKNDGDTALMYACLSKTPLNDLVRLLIEYGANINIKSTKLQRTALMNAAGRGHTSIVQYFLEQGAPVNTQDVDGATSLMLASQFGHPETVRVLLDYGADANMLAWSEEVYQTALMLACAEMRTVCVDLLLDGGADPNLCVSAYSPLSAACFTTGHDQPMDPTILEKLLSAGGNPNTQTGQDGSTALMIAASEGYDKGVQVLLNASADVNIQSSDGDTALHYAAYKGNLGISKMLLASGARASLTNSNGDTPLDYAQSNGHHGVCELLRSIMDSTATQDKITKPVQDSSQPHKPSRLLSIKPRRGILPSITSIGRYFKDLLLPDRAIKHRHSNQAQDPTTSND